MIANIIFLLFSLVAGGTHFPTGLSAYALLLLGSVLAGYVGTLRMGIYNLRHDCRLCFTGRLYRWSKGIHAGLSAISALLIWIVFYMK